MATARLINGCEIKGGNAYEVDTYPVGVPPFARAEGRNWDRFELLPGAGATFEWRTGSDRVRAVAQQLVAGRITADEALHDGYVGEWLERNFENLCAILAEERPDLAGLPYPDAAAVLLIEFGPGLSNDAGSYYLEDGDEYLHDALAALDLPSWAKASRASSGGPGSGFDAAVLVLKGERTLEDLAAWLVVRASRGAAEAGGT